MPQHKTRVRAIYFFIDIIFISLSFYLSYKLNPVSLLAGELNVKDYLPVFGFWALSLISLLHSSRLYYTDRYLSIVGECLRVFRCVLLSAVLAALFIFGFKIIMFSRIIFMEITLLLLFSLSSWRTAKRICMRYFIQRGYLNYHVLIVGAGKTGVVLSEEISVYPYLGIRVAGFLDDTKTEEAGGFKVLGKIKDLEEVIKKYFIDEIYVTIPSERRLVSEIIAKGAKLGKSVRIVSELFDLPYGRVNLSYIGIVPLMTYFEKGLHGSERFIKRLTDLIITGLILICLLPFLVIIAFLIKLESRGPVFYIAQRCGKRGKIFNFYKFRSMFEGADNYKEALRQRSEVAGPIFKIRNDPRITRIGRFLRKYSLDELPQLINVLKGDMSLVGPRPFPVEESRKIENKYMPRLNIRPGITGLAQVKGRSDLSFYHWARWDLWYIDNWSFGLDLKILWWTIPAVLKGRGAY